MQRGVEAIVLHVRVGTMAKQDLQRLQMAWPNRVEDGRAAVLVFGVDIALNLLLWTLLQQAQDLRDVALLGGFHEGVLVVQHELDLTRNREVTALRTNAISASALTVLVTCGDPAVSAGGGAAAAGAAGAAMASGDAGHCVG